MTTGTASALSGTINFGEVLPTSSAGTAMASLSSAMQSAEHQLMLLQQKQQQLLKLQQQKHKLEQQLADHVTHVGPKHKVIKMMHIHVGHCLLKNFLFHLKLSTTTSFQ